MGNGQIEAWADFHRDDACEGTFGCWTYLKIEMIPGDDSLLPVKSWQFMEGDWADDGWAQVTTHLRPGCNRYRAVAEAYNRAPGGSVGVTVGPLSAEHGNVQDYGTTEYGPETEYCLVA